MLLQFFHYLNVDGIWVGFEELEQIVQGCAFYGKSQGKNSASLDFSSPLRGVLCNTPVFDSSDSLIRGTVFYNLESGLNWTSSELQWWSTLHLQSNTAR